MHHIGTGMLNCIKELYSDKDIELNSLPSTVKFYQANGFEIVKKNKTNKLVQMKYSKRING